MGIRQDWTTNDLKNFISGRLGKVDRVQLIQFLKANEEFRLKWNRSLITPGTKFLDDMYNELERLDAEICVTESILRMKSEINIIIG